MKNIVNEYNGTFLSCINTMSDSFKNNLFSPGIEKFMEKTGNITFYQVTISLLGMGILLSNSIKSKKDS